MGEGAAHSAAGIIAARLELAWLGIGVLMGFPAWWSEVAIVAGLGRRLSTALPWHDYEADYAAIRADIAQVVPVSSGSRNA